MVPRRIDARWWVGVWCCFDVGLSSHVDKLTGSTMASHQQPPFNYRPFEDLMWRSSRNYTTVRSSDVAVAVSGHDGMLEWRQDSSTWVLSDERLSQRFFSRFDTILYTDSIDAELTVQGRHKGPIPARLREQQQYYPRRATTKTVHRMVQPPHFLSDRRRSTLAEGMMRGG